MLPELAIARGRVRHQRHHPKPHGFSYRIAFGNIDLDRSHELNAFRGWSANPRSLRDRLALVQFRDDDYFQLSDQTDHGQVSGRSADGRTLSLKKRVLQWVRSQPQGRDLGLTRVVMAGQLRQWGLCFNPVVFYFCYGSSKGQGEALLAIVSEITNTPWNERHAYLHVVNDQTLSAMRFEFDKVFHVSPFMPMTLRYVWRFSVSDTAIGVNMKLYRLDRSETNEHEFDASLRLALTPLDQREALLLPLVYPFQTVGVVLGIYWQALRLWLKRIPFFDHPDLDHPDLADEADGKRSTGGANSDR